MKIKVLFLFVLSLLAWLPRAYAEEGGVSRPGPLVLTDEQDKYPLGLALEILEDPGGELTIDDVASPEYADEFSPSDVAVPNYGFTSSAYWVRIPLRNESAVTTRWLLDIAFANTQFVDLFAPRDDGGGFIEKQSGTLRPASSRDIRHPRIIFSLQIPTASEQTFYLRFKNGASMTLDLVLWEPLAFAGHAQVEHLEHGIFFGVMLALLAYNLFLLISLREKSYLFLTLFIANFIIFEATYLGYLEMYVAPALYFLKSSYQALVFALISVWTILFSDSFLEAKSRIPKIHKANLMILAVWGVFILLIPFFSYHLLAALMVPWALPSMTVVLIAGIVSWRDGNRAARLFLFAWLGLLVTISITMLVRLGVAPSNGIFENAYLFGIMWMVVSWSLALADRINLLRDEAEDASHDLRQNKDRLAQILDGLPLGVVVYGSDMKPTFTNQRAIEILRNPRQGIHPDLSAGRTLSQAIRYFSFRVAGTDEAYPLERMPVYRALQGQVAYADDIEADLVDRQVPLEISASPVFSGKGEVKEAVIAFQDITIRKQAETALRASEAHFRVIVENVFDGIAFLDRDRQVLYVSPSYKQLNGKSPGELIGQSGVATVHPDDRAHVAEAFQRLLRQPGGRVNEEYRILHKDGSWVWVETRAMNMLDDPHVKAVVLNSRNVTERKRTEAELAEYRQHLERLVEERTLELEVINAQLSGEIAEREILEGLLHKRIGWMSAVSLARQRIKGTADLQDAFETLSATIRSLLEARSLFVLCWAENETKSEFVCALMQDSPALDADGIRACFTQDSALRRDLAQGNMRVFAADDAVLLPAPLQTCLTGDGASSLLLIPMNAGEAVAGVMGLTLPQAAQSFSPARTELVSKMALDLASLNEYAAFLDQSRSLVKAEERNRLARDLHDSVTQVLFTASLIAEVLPNTWRRDPDRAMRSLEELRRLTRGALAEMRTMLLELRPTALIRSPLHELLVQLSEASTSRTRLELRLLIEKIPSLPANVHTSFYRIAQEALNNVAKHAQAEQLTLRLTAAPHAGLAAGEKEIEVMLLVEDDGIGFSPESDYVEHLGMDIMRERAADIGADLNIESHTGQGTRVILSWCGAVANGS